MSDKYTDFNDDFFARLNDPKETGSPRGNKMNCLKCGRKIAENKCSKCGFDNTDYVISLFDISLLTFEPFEGIEENNNISDEQIVASSNADSDEELGRLLEKLEQGRRKHKKMSEENKKLEDKIIEERRLLAESEAHNQKTSESKSEDKESTNVKESNQVSREHKKSIIFWFIVIAILAVLAFASIMHFYFDKDFNDIKTIFNDGNQHSYWGDSDGGRPSYSIEEIESGILGDTITFNSICDESLKDDDVIEDEKDFVGAKVAESSSKGWYGDVVKVKDGEEYRVRLYVHNNNPKGEEAVAENVKVNFSIPSTAGKTLTVTGCITSTNAQPSSYWDTVNFQCEDDFYLDYVEGTAKYENNGMGLRSLSDSLVGKDGALLGYDSFNGRIPGCYEYAGYVTICVTAHVLDDTAQYWGPSRKTFTNNEPADYPVFNSITDNAAVGDERLFVRICEIQKDGERKEKYTSTGKFVLEPDREYEIYTYYQNDASGYNKDALKVKISSQYPTRIDKDTVDKICSTISSKNTVPQEIWAGVYITSNDNLEIHYVSKSALLYNSSNVSGTRLASDLFSARGVYIGNESLNGVIPADDGKKSSGHVNYRIITKKVETE